MSLISVRNLHFGTPLARGLGFALLLFVLACEQPAQDGAGEDGGSPTPLPPGVPSAPFWMGTTPESPSNSNTVTVRGLSLPKTTMKIYSDSVCTNLLGIVTANSSGQFAYTATVANNSTNMFYARASNKETTSGCSQGLRYIEDSVAPNMPTVTSASASAGQQNYPIISGTADPNINITIYEDSACENAKGNGVAGGNGSFSVTSTFVADATTTNFYALAIDVAGNVSNCSTTFATYSGGTPQIPTSLAVNPVSPANNNNPVLTGTTSSNVSVSVYTNATCTSAVLATGTANGSGNFSIPLTITNDTTTALYAKATNGALSSACSTSTVTYVEDSTAPGAPTVSGTTPASPSNHNSPSINGSAENNAIVRIYTNATCTSAVAATGSANGSGNFSIPVSVSADSSTTFYAQATDAAANTGACSSSSVNYLEDSTAPGLPTALASTPTGPANNNSPSVSGNAEIGSSVAVYTDSACSSAIAGTGTAAAGIFDISVSVTDNTATTFYAKATDAAGNAGSCSTNFVVYAEDSAAPSVPASLASDPVSPSINNTPNITGSTEANASVQIYTNATCTSTVAGSGTANGSGSFSIGVSVGNDSTTSFYAKATDSAGNASACSTSTVTYVEITAPPAAFNIAGAYGSGDSTANAWLTVSGLWVQWGASAGASSYDVWIRNSDNTADVCALTNTAAVTHDFSACSILEGSTYRIYVTAKNIAANTNASNTGFSFTRDSTAPTTGCSGVSGWIGDSATATPSCSDATAGCASTECRLDSGAWQSSCSFTSIPNGAHTISVRGTDNAGNVQSSGFGSCAFTTSGTAPTLALTDPTTGSATHVRQTSISISIGNDSGTAKWCVSETQTTRPPDATAACDGGEGGDNGWHTTRPTTLTLSSGDGSKTVYLWVADSNEDVYTTSVTDTITLDTNLPSIPTADVKDPNTNSELYTNQSAPSFTITGDTDAVYWCALDTANPGSPATPAWNAACWTSSKPSTVTLTATGVRYTYVFTKDIAHNISAGHGSDTIDYSTTAPARDTLALSEASANSGYARQTLVTATIGDGGGSAVRWCLSQTQSTSPTLGTSTCNGGAGPSNGWFTSAPTEFTLSSSQGPKTVYLWVANIYNNVSSTSFQASIILDSVAPGAFSIAGARGTTTDVTSDNKLTDGFEANVYWSDSSSENSYDVYIYENDGTTLKCSQLGKAQNSTNHLFSGCTLSDYTNYKIHAVAWDLAGNSTVASNSQYTFLVTPELKFTLISQSVSESVGSISVQVMLSRVSTFNVTANFTVSGTATYPSEHDLASGSYSITSGNLTDSKTITLYEDTNYEPSESIRITLDTPTNAELVGDGSTHGVIINDNDILNMNRPKVVAGGYFSCVLLASGNVKCWGYSADGQLGQSNNYVGDGPSEMGDNLAYVSYGTGRSIKMLSSSYLTTCAILDNDLVKCWGDNSQGQLGIGNALAQGDNYGEMGDTLAYTNLGTGRTAKKISVGQLHVCAILDNDQVKCWGDGGSGKTGYGSAADRGNNANQMGDNLPYVDLGTGRTAKDIAAYESHTCAILDNDLVKCWGLNNVGQAGVEDTVLRGDGANEMGDNLPYSMIGDGRTALRLGQGAAQHTCVILDDSSLKCWGAGASGRLGLGDTTNRGDGDGEMTNLPVVNLGTGRTAKSVTMGQQHTCAILDNDLVKCWGRASPPSTGESGMLGNGSAANNLADVGTELGDNLPYVPLGTGRTAKLLSSGTYSNCAVLDDNSMKCWGYNFFGQMGQGNTSNIGDAANEMGDNLSPLSLGSGLTVHTTNTNPLAVGFAHTCALLSNGGLKCWGNNAVGQRGTADMYIGDGPNEMGANLSAINLGTGRTALDLYAGHSHVCAILDDNTVKCWGDNSFGQLGLGNTQDRGDHYGEMGDNLPVVNLGTGRTVISMNLGVNHSCALLDNNSVKCWGRGDAGRLGNASTAHRGDGANEMGDFLPYVQLGTNRTVVAFDGGGYNNCAILDNEKVKCWGQSTAGQNGYGDLLDRGSTAANSGDNLAYIDLGTGRSAKRISASSQSICAELDNNSVKCWGWNASGQLGLGHVASIGDGANEMGDNLVTTNLGTGRTVKSFVADAIGERFMCVVLDNDAMKCWGEGGRGQLGNQSGADFGSAANQMGDNLPVVNLGTGRYATSVTTGFEHACAVLDDNTVKCWGENSWGQEGTGDMWRRGDQAKEMGDFLPVVSLE